MKAKDYPPDRRWIYVKELPHVAAQIYARHPITGGHGYEYIEYHSYGGVDLGMFQRLLEKRGWTFLKDVNHYSHYNDKWTRIGLVMIRKKVP